MLQVTLFNKNHMVLGQVNYSAETAIKYVLEGKGVKLEQLKQPLFISQGINTLKLEVLA